MTIWVNGQRAEPRSSAPTIHCEHCGRPEAILCINEQGVCHWYCAEHVPA